MEIKVKAEGEILLINGKSLKEFPVKIVDVLVFENKTVVLLDGMSYQYNRNIFCVDSEGNTIWQIPNLELQGVFEDNGSPYTRITKINNEIVSVVNWSGDAFHLDVNSGKKIKQIWSK